MKIILFIKITLIFLLATSVRSFAQGGDNAAAAAAGPITLPFSSSGMGFAPVFLLSGFLLLHPPFCKDEQCILNVS